MFYQTLNEAALRKALGTEVLKEGFGWLGGDRMRFVVTERILGDFSVFPLNGGFPPITPPK